MTSVTDRIASIEINNSHSFEASSSQRQSHSFAADLISSSGLPDTKNSNKHSHLIKQSIYLYLLMDTVLPPQCIDESIAKTKEISLETLSKLLNGLPHRKVFLLELISCDSLIESIINSVPCHHQYVFKQYTGGSRSSVRSDVYKRLHSNLFDFIVYSMTTMFKTSFKAMTHLHANTEILNPLQKVVVQNVDYINAYQSNSQITQESIYKYFLSKTKSVSKVKLNLLEVLIYSNQRVAIFEYISSMFMLISIELGEPLQTEIRSDSLDLGSSFSSNLITFYDHLSAESTWTQMFQWICVYDIASIIDDVVMIYNMIPSHENQQTKSTVSIRSIPIASMPFYANKARAKKEELTRNMTLIDICVEYGSSQCFIQILSMYRNSFRNLPNLMSWSRVCTLVESGSINDNQACVLTEYIFRYYRFNHNMTTISSQKISELILGTIKSSSINVDDSENDSVTSFDQDEIVTKSDDILFIVCSRGYSSLYKYLISQCIFDDLILYFDSFNEVYQSNNWRCLLHTAIAFGHKEVSREIIQHPHCSTLRQSIIKLTLLVKKYLDTKNK